MRSRCQTFVFQRPRLRDLVTLLRRVAEGEGIQAQDSALSLIARAARGFFRDAVSTLDQLAASTSGSIDAQSVLQLVGAVDEESLLRLCDMVVDRDTAGALLFIEELAERGQDLGRLVTDLIEHLRHLLLVQRMGHASRRASHRGDERAPPRAGEPAPSADRLAPHRSARDRRRGHAPGCRPAPSARARARQGDAPARRPVTRIACAPRRAPRGAPAERTPRAERARPGHRAHRTGGAPPSPEPPRRCPSSWSRSRRRGTAASSTPCASARFRLPACSPKRGRPTWERTR